MTVASGGGYVYIGARLTPLKEIHLAKCSGLAK